MLRLGIQIAAAAEAEAIIGNANYLWKEIGVGKYVSGTYPITLFVSGVGKTFSAASTVLLAEKSDLILSLGSSGTIVDDPVGAIRVCFEFIEWDMIATALGVPRGITPLSAMIEPAIVPCPPLLRADILNIISKTGLPIVEARSATGDTFIDSSELASTIAEEFGVSLVDMETAAAAKVCRFVVNVPFFAIRWVGDRANKDASGEWAVRVRQAAKDLGNVLEKLLDLDLTRLSFSWTRVTSPG